MSMPRFDSKNGSEEVSSESSRGSCAMSKNDEVPPEHLEPSLGTQTGNGMSFDPNAPAISAGTTIAPSETTNVDGMNNTNYDADQSDNNSDSSDEDDDTSESDDDSSDSSVHTPTSVISYSLISSYRTIDGVSSDSDAITNHNVAHVFVTVECRICRRHYVVPRGTIVCTRCGYAGLVHFGGN
ncbi:hypothetical protein EJB05_44825, partial [Eragrostis curvula]